MNNFNKTSLFIGGVLIVSVITVSSVFYIVKLINQIPPLEDFGSRKISQSTKIYDKSGEILLYDISGEEKRTLISFENIPDNIKKATLAVEDPEFYNQPAFNIRGIIRAFITNLKEGRIAQGGSTITQQLVKSTLLSPERTITRKIKELILAIELEYKYSKDDILEAYLNQIPYGSNAYGIESASQTFFNKSVSNLSLAESAALASLTPAPSRFSPWGDSNIILERKDNTLDRMHELGLISEQELEDAKSEVLNFTSPSLGTIKAPHFSLFIQNKLVEKYGDDFVRTEGLRVITTLDWELQQIAEEVVLEGARRNEDLYGGRNSALVVEDPNNGEILALVGSRDYFDEDIDGNFNVITQALRQPGSALKPFIYLEAIDKGYNPKTVVFDTHTEFVSNNPECPPKVNNQSRFNDSCFNPENFDGIFRGPVTLEEALSQSINIPAVKFLYLAGFDDVLETLSNFGITTLKERWRYGLSLVLGGGEIKPIELTNAYATLAREGDYLPYSFIKRVETSDGEIIETNDVERTKVYDSNQVRHINSILSNIELRSGLFQSSLGLTTFPNREIALKTGTTNDYRDAWAFGYTPSFVVGVWAGNNNNDKMYEQGSSLMAAIPMWNSFLDRVFNETDIFPDKETFNRPDPINTVDKPMINGEYIYSPLVDNKPLPQLHSILYWVDRNNPLGNMPQNPENDSQFINWQRSVHVWAENNIPNFTEDYNKSISYNDIVNSLNEESDEIITSNSSLFFENISIDNGDFISSPFDIEIDVFSDNPYEMEIILNNETIYKEEMIDDFIINKTIEQDIKPQNLLEIIITNDNGQNEKESIILYQE